MMETMSGHESPSLPDELMMEILLRVPVRSLLQFRCVCKSWKTLISDPQFAKDHLRTSTTQHQLLVSSIIDRKMVSYPVQSLFKNPSIPAQDHCFTTNGTYRILGSCNGLLCLSDDYKSHVMLWNPSIRLQSKTLPTSVLPPGANLTYYGFGYDHLNDKYKMLLVVKCLHDDEIMTKICTFGADSWRVVENFPCQNKDPSGWPGKFVSGTLNWIIKRLGGDDRWLIISFDLGRETYGQVLLPEGDYDKICSPVLDVLRNSLSICYFDSKEAHWVVWLMKEYGIQHSWTKLIIIPPFVEDSWSLYHPLCISENDDVMFETNFSEVVMYNSNNGRLDYLRITGQHVLYDMHTFHESLISPP